MAARARARARAQHDRGLVGGGQVDKKPTWELPAAEEAARKAAYRKALEEEVEAGNKAVEAAVRKAYTAWLAASRASRGG